MNVSVVMVTKFPWQRPIPLTVIFSGKTCTEHEPGMPSNNKVRGSKVRSLDLAPAEIGLCAAIQAYAVPDFALTIEPSVLQKNLPNLNTCN